MQLAESLQLIIQLISATATEMFSLLCTIHINEMETMLKSSLKLLERSSLRVRLLSSKIKSQKSPHRLKFGNNVIIY